MDKALVIRCLIILIFSLFMYVGVKLLFLEDLTKISGRFYIKKISNNRSIKHSDKYICDLLKKSGFSISLSTYYRIYQKIKIFFTIFLFIYIIRVLFTGTLYFTELIVILLVLSISLGGLKIGKYYTPVGLIFKYIDKSLKHKVDKELYSIIIQLQNISESQTTYTFNLTYILTRIIRFASLTKNAFIRMISYIDVNEIEEAKRVFEYEQLNTNLAENFINTIIQFDYIKPDEMKIQLKVLEDKARNNSIELRYKKEEFTSNLLYLMPTILCFLILMNFLRIVMNLVMGMISF